MKKMIFAAIATVLVLGLFHERAPIDLGAPQTAKAQAAPLRERLEASNEAMAKMLKTARSAYESIPFGGDAGTGTYADLYFWSCRWLEAERSRIAGNEEDIPAYRAHWERMKRIHQKIEALHRANAKGGEADKFHAASYFLAEAELWLLRAGGAIPQSE